MKGSSLEDSAPGCGQTGGAPGPWWCTRLPCWATLEDVTVKGHLISRSSGQPVLLVPVSVKKKTRNFMCRSWIPLEIVKQLKSDYTVKTAALIIQLSPASGINHLAESDMAEWRLQDIENKELKH